MEEFVVFLFQVLLEVFAVSILERLILRNKPSQPTPPLNMDSQSEVLWYLEHTNKIVAIKKYRVRMHVGLREAKQVVETIEREHNNFSNTIRLDRYR